MAVSPQLTYPSKVWKSNPDFALMSRIRLMAQNQILHGSMAHISDACYILTPRMMYRSAPITLQQAAISDSRNRTSRMVVSQRRYLNIGRVYTRGFPIPYLARVSTRPPYGEQWPRFAEYGSTI